MHKLLLLITAMALFTSCGKRKNQKMISLNPKQKNQQLQPILLLMTQKEGRANLTRST
jgi:hypothetical protein